VNAAGCAMSMLADVPSTGQVVLFPFAQYWWLYAGFITFVLVVLVLDLGVFHRQSHEVGFKEATIWSMVWISLALLFNLGLWFYTSWRLPQLNPAVLASAGFSDPQQAANQLSLEFLAGYVIEKSLSIDNIFVFVIIFQFFAVPAKYQHRVLFYGILGALVSRAIFIALGSVLLHYAAVIWIFGGFLVLTGAKLLWPHEKKKDLSKNPVLKAMRRVMRVSKDFHNHHFLVKIEGLRHATPLLAALVVVECSDIIFALDSVPAIFAITREPLIVFTSNIFAILGLRALYFLLAGAIDRFHALHYGLGLVLIFVGVKMVLPIFGQHVSIGISLAVICGVIGGSIAWSLVFPKQKHLQA